MSSRVEEDVDPPIVHKESCRFHAKDPLTEQYKEAFFLILFNVYIYNLSVMTDPPKNHFSDPCALDQTCTVPYYFMVFDPLFIIFYSLSPILLFSSSFGL